MALCASEKRILAPRIYEGGAPQGRGESKYLVITHVFCGKWVTPSVLASLGHLPHKWGRQGFFDNLCASRMGGAFFLRRIP